MDDLNKPAIDGSESKTDEIDSITGDTAGRSLEELAAIAKKNHMSVGKLKAAIYCNGNKIPAYIDSSLDMKKSSGIWNGE